jgi:nondiscriminating glutamyl-tRNA synthetase
VKTRVRYAPSPTGYLHVGGARTLLFNWLYAQKTGGKLILRIEDTDQARSTRESEKMILEDIEALGLKYDEGPTRQSERHAIYAEHAVKLLEKNQAYYCFCSDDLLTKKREAAMKLGRPPHYDGTCSKLPADEVKARLAKGERAGLRFRAYHKNYKLKDEVRGDIEFKEGTVGDFFITRSPTEAERNSGTANAQVGMPVYNFCCVIDDHLMGMTHIIRGEDHLSNTARQLMIYDAFGWETPIFAHTAMVLGSDRQKLSKRSGDVSVHEYLEKGFLPEVLLNFLVLLGWWPEKGFQPKAGHPEILSLDELKQIFNLSGLQKAPAVFDVTKLSWMNSFYLKHLPLSDIAERARPFFEKAGHAAALKAHSKDWYEGLVDTVRGEVALLSDLPPATAIFFETTPTIEDEAMTVLKNPKSKPVVETLVKELGALPSALSAQDVDVLQKKVAQLTGMKGKELFMPIRAAITGRTHGSELKRILPLLGREAVEKRITKITQMAGIG